MNRPRARSVIRAETTGSQIEYHHCGTPMPGEVSSKRKSSQTTRTLSTAMMANSSATISAEAGQALRRDGAAVGKNSMRIC
jgi:hypothetical protein